jgi:hypothetical protein
LADVRERDRLGHSELVYIWIWRIETGSDYHLLVCSLLECG